MFLFCLSSVACYSTGQKTAGTLAAGWTFVPGSTVMLMQVFDNGGTEGSGSGGKVYAGTIGALERHQCRVLPTAAISVQPALDDALAAHARYLLRIQIIEWEAHATAWTGEPDKGQISADLYEVRTRQIVARVSREDHAANSMKRWANELPEAVIAAITSTRQTIPISH